MNEEKKCSECRRDEGDLSRRNIRLFTIRPPSNGEGPLGPVIYICKDCKAKQELEEMGY